VSCGESFRASRRLGESSGKSVKVKGCITFCEEVVET